MEQIKKYIRGNKERGKEVIAELEKLGGVNQFKFKGDEEDKIYYIVTRKYNPVYCIDIESEKTLTGQLILTHPEWEEIELPKPKYPKTYDECCKVIDYALKGETIIGYRTPLLRSFQKLLIYRDAYWKIAGEEMGLGKPWEPDWKNNDHKFIIQTYMNEVGYWSVVGTHRIFSFPTEEMRDAFYENFKNEIEQCKELL